MTETWTVEQYRAHVKKPHKPKPKQKELREMKIMLQLAGIQFVEEHQFSDTRKFRFDIAIIDMKIGIEYEGIIADKSRHTSITGYSKDTQKYNLATKEGWRVLRYTARTYKHVLQDVNELIKNHKQ